MKTALLNIASDALSAPVRLPETLSREQIEFVRNMSALQVFTALMLTVAFVLLILVTVAMVLNLKKTALGFLILVGACIVMVPSGYSQYYGGMIATIALGGLAFELFRPRQRKVAANTASGYVGSAGVGES